MQILELWPYALVALSGVALLVVVSMLLLTRSPDTRRRPATRLARPAAARKPASAEALSAPRLRPSAPAPQRADPAASMVRQRTFSAVPDDRSPDSAAASPRIVPSRSEPEPPRAAPMAAREGRPAVVERVPDPAGELQIPAFLRRQVAPKEEEAAEPVAEAPEDGHPLESQLGTLVYNPPETMRARVAETVTVRIVRDRGHEPAVAAAFVGLRGRGAARSQEIPTSASMTVQLFGAHEAFHIEPRSPLMQVLDTRRGFAEWSFRVTPLQSGTQELELVVAGCRLAGGQIEAEDQETVVVRIRVRVNARSLAARVLRAVAATAGVALVTWLVTVNADAIRSRIGAADTAGQAPPAATAPPQ